MIILGVDPGDTIGFALLDVPPRGPGRYLWHGDGDETDALALVRRFRPQLVAIERGAGVHAGIARKRGVQAALSIARCGGDAQEAGGFVRGACAALEVAVVELAATRARTRVVGSAQASDAMVGRAVARLVTGWPWRGKLPGGNAHARDAAVCALAAGWGVLA